MRKESYCTKRNNSIDGFDTRKTIIADEDGAFDLELTIAILESGEKVAYAKKYVAPNKDVTGKIQANERISSSHLDQMPDGNKIAQKDGTVKQRYSIAGENAASADMEQLQRAKEMKKENVAGGIPEDRGGICQKPRSGLRHGRGHDRG